MFDMKVKFNGIKKAILNSCAVLSRRRDFSMQTFICSACTVIFIPCCWPSDGWTDVPFASAVQRSSAAKLKWPTSFCLIICWPDSTASHQPGMRHLGNKYLSWDSAHAHQSGVPDPPANSSRHSHLTPLLHCRVAVGHLMVTHDSSIKVWVGKCLFFISHLSQ